MDEYLRFENAIFCSSNCNFLRFCSQPVFATDFFFFYHAKYNCRGLIFGVFVSKVGF